MCAACVSVHVFVKFWLCLYSDSVIFEVTLSSSISAGQKCVCVKPGPWLGVALAAR